MTVKITEANDGVHKYRAVFTLKDGGQKTVLFGAVGYGDFIQYNKQSKDMAIMKKQAYDARHRVTERWNDPMTAGALSKWILWNKPTLEASIADFKKRFNL